MKLIKGALLAVLFFFPGTIKAQESELPNIVIILTDDQGFADISFNPEHPPEVSTPHMDALASEGIYFSQAYITGNVCSPTRAGLMTGRYQQRAGVYTAGEGGAGIDLAIPLFPKYLEAKGYVSGAFGKWHLGEDIAFNPIHRGFDEFYGFMGRGAHDYYNLSDTDEPLYRGLNTIQDEGYLTNLLTEEAVSFIKNHKDEPFFCYLAYNAVHTPMQAPAEDIADFNTGSETRNILMAMLRHLDNGVGEVVNTLKAEGVWDNTILFFLTDNGGASATEANNTPLRGTKQLNWEGGVRTPFVFSWPEKYSGSRVVHTPIISLDILPTVMDALDVTEQVDYPMDGKSILPLAEGEAEDHHDFMFWSEGGESGEWAVRYNDWKLVVTKDDFHLSDLGTDISESTNLIDMYPDTVDYMIQAYLEWLNEMAEPMQVNGKSWIPKMQDGQLASIYDRLYFRGDVKHFDKLGNYHTAMIDPIEDNKASSVLLAEGFGLKAYSDDQQQGEELVFTRTTPMMASVGDGLSSFTLDIVRGADIKDVSLTASDAAATVNNVRDDDYTSYWEGVGESNTWISFEFCRAIELDAVHIAFKRGDVRVAYFEIEASLDGTTWTTLISNGSSNGVSRNLESFSFPATHVKHLRIQGRGNSDNAQNHYTEVKFSVLGLAPAEGLIRSEDYSSASDMEVCLMDDCAGYLGLTNTTSNAEVTYLVNDFQEGYYSLDLRMKALKSGEVAVLVDDVFQDHAVLGVDDIDNEWTNRSMDIYLPAGEKSLTLRCIGMASSGAVEMNWLQLSPGTSLIAEASRELCLYPNPCGDFLSIRSPAPIGKIEVFDQSGRLIRTFRGGSECNRLELAGMKEGLYIAGIRTKQGIEYLKFLKQIN